MRAYVIWHTLNVVGNDYLLRVKHFPSLSVVLNEEILDVLYIGEVDECIAHIALVL
jgi:hypothetical protein